MSNKNPPFAHKSIQEKNVVMDANGHFASKKPKPPQDEITEIPEADYMPVSSTDCDTISLDDPNNKSVQILPTTKIDITQAHTQISKTVEIGEYQRRFRKYVEIEKQAKNMNRIAKGKSPRAVDAAKFCRESGWGKVPEQETDRDFNITVNVVDVR